MPVADAYHISFMEYGGAKIKGGCNKRTEKLIMGLKEITDKINIDEYNYDLPEERIAQYPLKERDMSQLLVFTGGRISKDIFRNIANYIPSDSLLVFNNTKVIRARLLFTKETGAAIEIFCLEPLNPGSYELSLTAKGQAEWKCLIGNLKKWKRRTISKTFCCNGKEYELTAEKIKEEGDAWRIRFKWIPGELTFGEVIGSFGHIPLPPYVKRNDEELDYIRYQTIYSSIEGSVASPTAGLHFTNNVINSILGKGIKMKEITLHTGAGTFQPVRGSDITKHKMHCEHYIISRKLIEELLQTEDRIIACGTTSVRTLESIFWLGNKLLNNQFLNTSDLHTDQWEPYLSETRAPVKDSLTALLDYLDQRKISFMNATTRIMIVPGYEFRITNGIITNFHMPKSTLLLLISAWTGQDWKKIYRFALCNNFRFLSYGDSSLLMK
ncbi:MAG: S-adenosylmethionine:tRNA ribosyltransferase-isomerase [Bacteroidetes bacterium ADurb.Bin145]|nr:MAG: S-adenosylmethionine:tRNA ribosyltransferase-isomerase [Bacteroidetes bacterium ADurb.Bin145]